MNAKDKIQLLLDTYILELRCAVVQYKGKRVKLCDGYTEEQYAEFMRSLDFEYDNGYDRQLVYGTLWFKTGTWATNHDCSDLWDYHRWPEIPEYLKS